MSRLSSGIEPCGTITNFVSKHYLARESIKKIYTNLDIRCSTPAEVGVTGQQGVCPWRGINHGIASALPVG
jgi:hypothetical protein